MGIGRPDCRGSGRAGTDAETRSARRALQGRHDERHGDTGPVPDPLDRRVDGAGAEGRHAFLASLTPEQRAKTTFPVDDIEWRKWNNVHRYARQGVSFKEMTEAQREQAFGLLQAGLSAKGLEKSRNIMRLNETIAELTKQFEEYGEGLYHLTVMGEPSATEPWGWQLDGHHLIVNYFVLGDQVVMTPTFMGSEPVIARERANTPARSCCRTSRTRGSRSCRR